MPLVSPISPNSILVALLVLEAYYVLQRPHSFHLGNRNLLAQPLPSYQCLKPGLLRIRTKNQMMTRTPRKRHLLLEQIWYLALFREITKPDLQN
mmetsp:Transcript_64186/g.114176  ORF Transcript_64186/g.114176 Transcript_64186/m.114176 type:complete len:94 (+) Transcript_64186:679-960(+)